MNKLLVILAVLCSTYAIPQDGGIQTRFVDGIIGDLIEDLSNSIAESGYDPYYLNSAEASYQLPVPVLFSAEAYIKHLHFNGASNIIINNISWSLIWRRVELDISLPRIFVSVDKAAGNAVIFGRSLSASVKGSIAIQQPRVTGTMTFGIIGGINLSSINMKFNLGGIFSLLDVDILGENFASPVNKILTHKIPQTLKEFSAEINELVTIVVGAIIEKELSR